jgi:hypothetical protein
MPSTEPGPARPGLGFVRVVREAFAFLEGAGFAVVSEEPTFVRYESPTAFVNVFHGRGSYELGIEFGRWVEVDDERVEQKFPLADVIALTNDLGEVGFQSFTATTRQAVAAFVPRLAAWAREFGHEALGGDRTVFELLSATSAARSVAMQEGWRASRLRQAAEDAWHRKDWGRVVDAYAEIESDLPTVELQPSEIGRLRYARRRLG